ncbi:ferritin-like domain-containing protein [Desulfoluna spongiiphila]|uniref:Rubrerythrin n=1 Tax=Desulfoluna spongiiphila TaxID=419481 RepID=A0A1G5AUK5_9BACT|nr:ferritin family protein [Desulfoluna spongiiphila]SCX81577.1 Rubrerythrin [Desulfoluna spongiiphila]VVS92019.1 rubrerythrin [Desulfoluna spongiiphila]
MGLGFNADEIFEMAEQIERNGAKYYRDAAEAVTNADDKSFLVELAAMEDDHEVTFAGLRKELSEDDKAEVTFDPEGEAAQYLKALADTRVFYDKAMDLSSMAGILKGAITAEKDSIVFYLGMKDMVSGSRGKARIDDIIKEEMKHIKLLSGRLLANGK